MSRIIILNGCSSAGKTSISKSIQGLSDTPGLHIGIDTFIGMLPSKFSEFGDQSSDGYYSFVHSENERGACVQVKTGPMGEIFFQNHVPKVVQLFANLGHDIVVQVTCEYEVLLERERLRLRKIALCCDFPEPHTYL